MDAKKLLNQKNFIIKSKKITQLEIDNIKEQIEKLMQDNRECISRDQPIGNENPNITAPVVEIAQEGSIEIIGDEVQLQNTNADRETKELETKIRDEFYLLQSRSLESRKRILKKSTIYSANIQSANKALENILVENNNLDLFQINALIYACAYVVSTDNKQAERHYTLTSTKSKGTRKPPPWKLRIQKKIEKYRKLLSQLASIQWHNISVKQRHLLDSQSIFSNNTLAVTKENLKQKISALAYRIKRYEKRNKQFKQNNMFNQDKGKLFRELTLKNCNNDSMLKFPEKNDVERFWRGILESDANYNEKARWIKRNKKLTTPMEWNPITKEEVVARLKKANNWKASGPYGIPNFWLKRLPAAHECLARNYNYILNNPENIPHWLTVGRTTLIFKSGDTENPKNYRPITCLNTIYKILTGIIADKLYKHLEIQEILPYEQKGCRRNAQGCRDQVLLSNIIAEDCKRRKKNLSIAWVDYKKAYDSIPHSWIGKSLQLAGANDVIIQF
ncbi:uncharacterized protein LOC115881195 [Sitophilus oryzae]|uniref:Uncharacterized protein LOC115881195 n=1 Tax=Sitophilus oryzae TaxID=7048 RepID=A0A6J2XSH5_SITOR|nr:uncharacterized protein LOC115881195 [Sitophilus oryzae]